ncbi:MULTISPECIES: hypothetical protein [unclassified Streptomyces]|uniref:MmyB family transcriptional regulator n=1 Tax=unclassified Streptomyces TaxID=2593676 RepID=UPI001319ECD3|nr:MULTISPECIES: hypothetical protein [unclassified Streptomyces]MYT29864.1 hypothetical protein [Streptomyces sp. SID8354]
MDVGGPCAYGTRDYRHPLVGPLTLTHQVLKLPDDEGQRVVVFNAAPGSPTEAGTAAARRAASTETPTQRRDEREHNRHPPGVRR